MPHLITNRARQHNLIKDYPAGHLHFAWESINAILYLVGGLAFIVGSVFFLPVYERLANTGVWIYLFGSFLYLIVTLHDLLESMNHLRSQNPVKVMDLCEFFSAMVYLWKIVDPPIKVELFTYMAWEYIVGSFLFFTGGIFNYYRIFKVTKHYQKIAFMTGM
ncbi:YrhK family protein [Roseofilum capinflatum]|uniref:YrhK family protein n=1 Tax=Roseofilum capinflatum BLCC-M114 TaxID=3022440 RepID=A0ABT7BDQ6_9CYAN|nr:YrhK family protein [Roseofilum capinflatum]MDJ1176719.1 YrhK family protein [Roseofilum capinflatum BLCC-M114]